MSLSTVITSDSEGWVTFRVAGYPNREFVLEDESDTTPEDELDGEPREIAFTVRLRDEDEGADGLPSDPARRAALLTAFAQIEATFGQGARK